MKRIIFCILLLCPLISLRATSIDTSVFRYFPLAAGNRWTWYVNQNFAPGPSWEVTKIEGVSVLGGHLLYYFRRDVYIVLSLYHYYNHGYMRIDSLSGNLYSYDSLGLGQCLMDSLNSKKGDSAYTICGSSWYRCDTGTYSIFNQNPKTKTFSYSNYFEAGGYHKYSLNFGRVYAHGQAVMSTTDITLRGCVINSILSGDTSVLVGVQSISTEIPESFSLYQNYPNPFNPSTKIKFEVPRVGAQYIEPLQLRVYNSLGQQVAVLVNEQLQPGTYEVEWNAAEYPSGAYFYRLEAGNYAESKKMLMIK
jgi:hypothetical protein